MRIAWMTGLVLLYVIGMVISLTLEGEFLGSSETTVLYRLMNPEFGSFTNPLSAIGGFFIMIWNWIQAVWDILTWDYSFFRGSLETFRYVGWAGSIAMVVSLVLAVRGTGSS